MPIVSFWSTEESAQTATTSSIVATACAIALRNTYKVLVTQTNYADLSLESSFVNIDKMTSKGDMDIADIGIDALDRLLRSNKLTPENMSNYAKPIYDGPKNKLEVLYGTFKNDIDSYSRILETMPIVIDYASRFYDIVLVDLSKGINNAEINKILQKSDLIVLTLSQDMQVLKKIFKSIDTYKILQEKSVIPVIGKYDRFSKYNNRNIARVFNYKKQIYTIPYNTQFFDACNEGKSMSFYLENIRADLSTDRNGFFISETNKLADAIVDAVKSKLS